MASKISRLVLECIIYCCFLHRAYKEREEEKMGLHSKSNKEKRKKKYAEQFARTAENKKRKAEKRVKRFGK